MMFLRVNKAEFYDHVSKCRRAARVNGQTFDRREADNDECLRISYEVGGVPTAQAVMPAPLASPKYYVLK